LTESKPRWVNGLILAMLAIFAGRVLYQSTQISATYDEPAHLVAGYTYLRWGDYRLNPEHPPLVKKLAALPLLWLEPWPESFDINDPSPYPGPGSMSWQRVKNLWRQSTRSVLSQWPLAHELLYGVTDQGLERLGVAASMLIDTRERVDPAEYLNDADRLLFWARLPVIGFGLLVCLLVFLWARDLFGWAGGVLALAVCAFDPNLTAHSGLVTTDVAATMLIFGSTYGLWRWSRRRDWRDAALAVVCFALAFTAKFSAVLLIPPMVVLSLAVAGQLASRGERIEARRTVLLLIGCGVAAYLAVWASFGFRYSAVAPPLDDIRLPVEETLERVVAREARFDPEVHGKKYLGALDHGLAIANRMRLMPESYLIGLAYARMESRARPAFLRGELRERGFRSFFVWTTLLKTPLVVLLAIVLAVIFVVPRLRWLDGLFLLFPVLFFLAAAIGSHLNIGHRHLLPVFPFLYVLVGGLATRFGKRWLPAAVAILIVGSTVVFAPPWRPSSSFGEPFEYFNELAGGPRQGYRHLVDSNLDWGQGLKDLAQWLGDHDVDEPINLCYFGNADPRFYQIRHVKMPGGYVPSPPLGDLVRFDDAIIPGYVAISATHLQGPWLSPEERRQWRAFLETAELVGTAGNSIQIYHLR